MEFWGVEVKAGKPLKVQPELGKLIHISHAALGEIKDVKGAKNVPLRLKIGDQKFIIGTLSAEDRPQVMFDLVFEKQFELSHDWKNGSVYFVGYFADEPSSDDEGSPSESEDVSEEELVGADENGVAKPKPEGKKVPKLSAPAKVAKEDSESSDDDADKPSSDDEMGEDDSSDDLSGDDSDESSESSDEEDTHKVQESKKRPAETAQKTPPFAKKARAVTPEKSSSKKVPQPHIATPFPSKAAAGASGKKPIGQSPPTKSDGKKKAQFNKGKRGGK